MRKLIALSALCIGTVSFLSAKISTPSIFGSNMVLQRDHACPVWGWADPNASVTLTFAGKVYTTKADESGEWKIKLTPLSASSKPRDMVLTEGKANGFNSARKNFSRWLKNRPGSLVYENILVGEVWLCSGQSNMKWSIDRSDDADLETLSGNHPNLRLITVPNVGSQEPQKNFEGSWQEASLATVSSFSAVGYLFGKRLHHILGVPVGLINNAWGGSACEAWVPRDRLSVNPISQTYLKIWQDKEKTYHYETLYKAYEEKLARWKSNQASGTAQGRPPQKPRNEMTGQHRPANLYNGVLYPIIGYGIRGAIWYQGESNAGRGYAYRETFPMMIQSWRQAWAQGDFPFYWVQLADFRNEVTEPGHSEWAELRESQTLTLDKLRNVGEAVIIDAGEGRDIHPRNKQIVANRLLRHALAKNYGHPVPHQSPRYKSIEVQGRKIILTFNSVDGSLYCFDSKTASGFSICGEDQKFVRAEAKIVGKDKVEVWSESVPSPIAVRYAWADNPICNLYDKIGAVTLPVTPFRTDNFTLTTTGR